MPRPFVANLLFHWLDDYSDVQDAAVLLLYLQVFVGLPGTLHDTHTSLLAADVAVALFGLVAVASTYQALCRTYAALLAFMIVLDVCWMSLYARDLWETAYMQRASGGASWWPTSALAATALAALASSLLGFCLRLLSAVCWVQMFRLGLHSTLSDSASQGPAGPPPYVSFLSSSGDISGPDHLTPLSGRTPELSPRYARQRSHSEDFLGSSIFHPASFAALFQPGQLQDYLGEEPPPAGQGPPAVIVGTYAPPATVPEGVKEGKDELMSTDEEMAH